MYVHMLCAHIYFEYSYVHKLTVYTMYILMYIRSSHRYALILLPVFSAAPDELQFKLQLPIALRMIRVFLQIFFIIIWR